MYQPTQAFTTQLNKSGRTFRARITVGNTKITAVKTYTLTSGSCGADAFSIGSVFASYVDIVLGNTDTSLTGREMYLETGLLLPGGTIEYIPMGYFTAQKPSDIGKERDQITIHAVDRITTKGSGLYAANVPFPCTVQEVLDDIAAQAEIEIVCGLDTTGIIEESMDKLVYRDALGYIAGLLGGFCYADRNGRIRIAAYPETENWIVDKDWIRNLTVSEINYEVEGITAVVKENGTDADGNETEGTSFTSGAGSVVSFSNPYMTQALFDAMQGRVVGYSFNSGEVSFVGNPLLDPEDAVSAVNRKEEEFFFPCMNIVQEFDGGITTTISTPGAAESDETVKGPIQKAVEQLQTEMVLAKELVAKKLTAEQADIRYAAVGELTAVKASIETLKGDMAEFDTLETDFAALKKTVTEELEAQDAQIGNLTAKDAQLEELIADKAQISDLEAMEITTGNLTAKVGDIETLLNGNLTSDNIHSMNITSDKFTVADAFIKDAMIEDMAFDKLTGIDLNTTRMTVHSEDGKSVWKDNTIQISDAARIRVQIGKDASGDYNIYIWDKDGNLMFDPLYGIQEDGIKRAIIRDGMVAEDAAISGSKLDIESVVEEVNGATTKLKTSAIYLDEKEQTLDVAFKTLESTVEGQQETIRSHETKIEAAEGSIKTLIADNDVIKDENEELQTRYSELDQTVEQIGVTVGKHESTFATKQEVNDLEIGGRNLLKGTSDEWMSVEVDQWFATVARLEMAELMEEYDLADGDELVFSVTLQGNGKTLAARWQKYNSSADRMGNTSAQVITTGAGRSSVGLQVDPAYTYLDLMISNVDKTEDTTTEYYKELKLEKGNKATDWTPAPEDVERNIDENEEKLREEIYRQTSESIVTAEGIFLKSLEGYVTRDELEEYQESNSASLEVLSDQVKIQIEKELSKGVDKVATATGVTVDESGITVDRSDSEMTTNISHDGMKINKDGEEVLAATNQGVDAKNLHATTYLIIGKNSRLEDYEQNGTPYTACFWIGG